TPGLLAATRCDHPDTSMRSPMACIRRGRTRRVSAWAGVSVMASKTDAYSGVECRSMMCPWGGRSPIAVASLLGWASGGVTCFGDGKSRGLAVKVSHGYAVVDASSRACRYRVLPVSLAVFGIWFDF